MTVDLSDGERLFALRIITIPADTDFCPGRYDDFSADRYYALEALSASGMVKLLRSAAHYREWRDNPSPATPAMQFGTVVHGLVLEPERDIVAIAPNVERRSNADKATWAEFEAQLGKRIAMKQADSDRTQRVRDAVFAHASARALLDASGHSEVTLLWHDEERDTHNKARIDRLRDGGGLIDLKTTSDVMPTAFARKAANGLLYMQAAHYSLASLRVLKPGRPSECAVIPPPTKGYSLAAIWPIAPHRSMPTPRAPGNSPATPSTSNHSRCRSGR